jgi:hypothetical protein
MPFHLIRQQRFRLRRLLRTTADLSAYRRTLALLQWRHGKERICANRQYASIEEQVHHFLHYLEGLSVEETLRKAGVLSEDYWLKSE